MKIDSLQAATAATAEVFQTPEWTWVLDRMEIPAEGETPEFQGRVRKSMLDKLISAVVVAGFERGDLSSGRYHYFLYTEEFEYSVTVTRPRRGQRPHLKVVTDPME